MAEGVWTESIHRRSVMVDCLTGVVTVALGSGNLQAFSFVVPDESKVTNGELKDWKSMSDLKGLEAAFEFLDKKLLADMPAGKHSVHGDDVYALVLKLPSRAAETAQFESHRKYIDIHYVLSGQETSGSAPAGDLKLAVPYDESKDVALYHVPKQFTRIQVRPGRFVVYHPGQAHLPNCHLEGQHNLHKVVVKVHVDYLAARRKAR